MNGMRDNIYSFDIWFSLIEIISNLYWNHFIVIVGLLFYLGVWVYDCGYANTNAIKLLRLASRPHILDTHTRYPDTNEIEFELKMELETNTSKIASNA